MRLIDACALQEEYKARHSGKRLLLIDVAPTVNAVPVVRCKDCNEYQDNFHWCKLHDVEMQPLDFCSYGERKDG